MIARISIQLLILCAMTVVSIYSKEYILEDLVAMEDNNRRNVHNTDAITANNDGETQKITRQRQTISVRQKKADKGSERVEEGGETNDNGQKKSNSVANNNNNKDDDDEDKKTLAQQVADGKYGLIQREIFPETPKRPGIISYEVNPEVPRDNVNNLGGLKPEEIWLAENHLLVLAGGGKYSEDRDNAPVWKPIDSYRAPPRQVKIPPNPKVPPPFPVQLRPGGPTEFIRGENGTGGPPLFPPIFPPANFSGTGLPPSPFFGPPPGFHPGNFTPGNGPPVTPFPFQFPQLPPGLRNGSIPRLPPPGAFPPGLPPGANFLPPPGNFTGQFDEDDPSIYYPPPYDFVYRRENTTAVPPGPLVPGIVLPPPPDFFAPLEDEKRTKPKRPGQKTKRPQQIPGANRGKSDYRYPTTTKRPSVQIVTDEPAHQPHLNEVTPTTLEHVLPPNAEVRGWVPIPAPRPFYITGPRKTIVQNPDLESIRNGYQYDRPYPGSFAGPEVPNSWNYADNRSQPVSFNVNSNYDQSGYKEGNIFIHPTTTISPVPYQSTPAPKLPGPSRGKAVKSYYFYDEPTRLVTTQPPSPFEPYYSSTPRPLAPNPQYFTTTVRSSPRPFQAEQPPPSPGPLQYFYITKRPQPIESSTSKPPVYEYSYTAPGYGTLEAPKLSSVSTPGPSVHQAPPIPQYDLNNYYQLYDAPQSSTRPPTQITYSTTAAPPIVHTTTIRPDAYDRRQKFPPKSTPSPFILQTENPYHAYFTHHDYSLIDDITKKYFTIFGQKINAADGATTPLPPVGSRDEIATKSPAQKPNKKVKFPIERPQTPVPPVVSNDYSYYWSSTRPPSAARPGQNVYPQYQSDYDYYEDVSYNNPSDYRYKYLQDIYNLGGGRQSASLVQQQQPQPSYEGDTRVNFVQPLPAKDPDAEEFSVVPLKNQHQQSRPTSSSYVGRPRPNSVPAPSLRDDTRVNFVSSPPAQDPDAEIFDPSKLKLRYQGYGNSYGGRTQNNVVSIRPPSLHDDTRVNYVNPRPAQDPDAELFDPAQLGYQNTGNRPPNPYLFGRSQQQQQQQQSQQLSGLVQNLPSSPRPPTLEGDTNVNYLHPRPPTNPDAEIFNPKTRQQIITNLFNEFVGRSQVSLQDDTKVNDGLSGQAPDPAALVFDPKNPPPPDFSGRGRQNDIVAYRLPGNGGGHFYFLTPQTAVQQANYPTQDAIQQNLFRRNVRRQSGSGQENTGDEEKPAESQKQPRRPSRTDERRRNNTNNNNSNNRSSSNNNNNNNDNQTT